MPCRLQGSRCRTEILSAFEGGGRLLFSIFGKERKTHEPARDASFRERELLRLIALQVVEELGRQCLTVDEAVVRQVCREGVEYAMDDAMDRWIDRNIDDCIEQEYSDARVMANATEAVVGWLFETQRDAIVWRAVARLTAGMKGDGGI